MLSVALCTLRARWVTFVGSFVALSLGVALLAVMGLALASSLDAPDRGPERFAAAPVVVRGVDTLRVSTPAGDRTERLAQPRAVPARVVAKLKELGTVVEDRSFAVRAAHGPGDLVGHPWSTAAFAPYTITAGRPPKAADEVVVSGAWARPGERVRTGRGTVRVVGTVADRGFENAVFYTDARAAHLAPASVQLVVDADPAAVRAAVRGSGDGDGVHVWTGAARRSADPGLARDREAVTAMNALFGTAGGVSAFVSVFVVSSTFAFAVAQRRREFGLLRSAGATPGQVRRTVCAEALAVGVLASATGCLVGSRCAPLLAARVVDTGLAPDWFAIGDATWPYHLAFWTGLLVALCGVAAASWRAGRVVPTEALREASVDGQAMTWGRRLAGTALLLTAAVTLGLALIGDPGELLHRKTYVSRPMLLITACALLAPLVVRPLARLLAWLPARLPGAVGMLVRENAAAGVRRTAAIAAPVLVTVALAGSLWGATSTLNAAKATETREQTTAAFVVTPADGAGFDAATLTALRKVPGAEVSATSSSAVYVLEDGTALTGSEARAAEPGPLAATTRLPLAAGDVRDLDDGSIIVNEEWQRHTVGQRVRVWLGDGTRRTLRIAAVMATGTGDNGVYVTPRNAPGAHVDRVDVALADGADARSVAAGLRAALRDSGGQLRSKAQWVRATSPQTDRTTRLGFLLVLGIALLYAGISLANTMVMATSDRVRDLAVLRLAGATRGQVLLLVGTEALMVVAVGALLGVVVAGLNLAGMWGALGLLSVWTTLALPWATIGATVAACAVLAVVSSVAPAALALRRRAVELAGIRE
ncbi:ABC transporter permease [Streptomyces odontomachi]|uniref:ABC transporter permease n=1 Tax=Streptomyces odontomachi TaxID=2944940 RepID=UPI00210ADB87|nr:FtsX-like permease family protein [Streptomyces sp. ODS25]